MLCIDSGGHYLYYPNGIVITISLLFMESLRFLVFFLVCYYFTMQAANLLLNKQKWRCSLRILLAVNIAWCLSAGILNFIAYSNEWDTYKQLCHTTLFMMLRFSGEVVTGLFVVIGILITRKINQIQVNTRYEKEIKPQQKRAILRLW